MSDDVRPWTKSRGPIQATEQDVRKADAINALLVRPIALLPTRVGDPILPFTIGIFDTIRQHLKPETSPTPLRRAVGTFVHSKRYFFACAQPDSMRHDVDGQPIEPLSQEDRLSAQQKFLALKQAVAPPQVPPPTPEPSKSDLIRAALLGRKTKPERTDAG